MFRNGLISQYNVSKFVDTFHKFIKSSQSVYHNGFACRDTISTWYINTFIINYQLNHTQYTQSNMILQYKLHITIQISCKTNDEHSKNHDSNLRCPPPRDHSPGCWQPSRTSLFWTTTRTDVRFSVLTVIPRRITADTLPTTRLPQWRRSKRHAISQRDITRLTSTVDYGGSPKNGHYWPNLPKVGGLL